MTEPLTFVIAEQPVNFIITEQPVVFNVGEGIPLMMNFSFGSKASAVDAGVLGEISFDDDFLYICVEAGAAGFAKWKGFFGVVK